MSDVVEDLERVYTGAVSPDMVSSDLGRIMRNAIAEALALIDNEGVSLSTNARLGTSTGGFVDLHARDRGLRRQNNESDDQLKSRLRNPPKAVTVEAILDAVQAIIGDAGKAMMVELPRESLYYNRAVPGTNLPRLPESQPALCYDRGRRFGGGRGVVIVLIPASAGAMSSVMDAVRSKISAGKRFMVQEYT